MRRRNLASDLVRKLQEMNSISREDEEHAVGAAIETFRDTEGVEISPEMAYQALEEVKREREESRWGNKVKKYFSPVLSFLDSARDNAVRYARTALLTTAVSGTALGVGLTSYQVTRSFLDRPPILPPSGFVEGVVLEEWEKGNNYRIKVEGPEKIYDIDFDDNIGAVNGRNTIQISDIIEEGTIVRFPTENLPISQQLFGLGRIRGEFYPEVSGVIKGIMDPGDLEIRR